MAVEHIQPGDSLNNGRSKINEAIDQSNDAISKATNAESTANQALSNSQNTQTQLDTIVINGDSSVEAAQARVDSEGNTFTTLKERLDTKEDSFAAQLAQTADKFTKIKQTDTMLISAFNGRSGQSLDLYISYDGIKFHQIGSGVYRPSNSISSSGNLRDPSWIFHNNYFYIAFTTNLSGGQIGFGIVKTKDFINFDEYKVPISDAVHCWAPEFLKDGDDVYVSVSLNFGESNMIDKYGDSIPYFKQYLLKATDETLLAYDSPIEMFFPDTEGKIDGSFIKKDSTYHCFIKSEYDKTIKHYINTSLTSGQWSFVQTIPFPSNVDVEGACCVEFNGEYLLYADGYMSASSWCVKSTDLENWGVPFKVGSPSGLRSQHFFANVLDEGKQNLDDIISRCLVEKISDKHDTVIDRPRVNLNDLAVGGVIESLQVRNGVHYYVDGSNSVTINDFDLTIVDNDICSVFFSADTQGSGTIRIKNGTNVLTPKGKDIIINRINSMNDIYFEFRKPFTWIKKFKLVNMQYLDKTDKNRIDLATMAIGGVVNSLAVEDEAYYYVSGTSQITINDIDLTNVSGTISSFFLCCESGTSGSITLKNGTNILTPGNVDFVISKSNGNNDVIYEFRKPFTWMNKFRLK